MLPRTILRLCSTAGRPRMLPRIITLLRTTVDLRTAVGRRRVLPRTILRLRTAVGRRRMNAPSHNSALACVLRWAAAPCFLVQSCPSAPRFFAATGSWDHGANAFGLHQQPAPKLLQYFNNQLAGWLDLDVMRGRGRASSSSSSTSWLVLAGRRRSGVSQILAASAWLAACHERKTDQ